MPEGLLIISGVPFVLAAAVDANRSTRPVRLALIASVPTALAVLVYLGGPYKQGLAEVAFGPALVAFGWVAGFGAAAMIRRLARHGTRRRAQS